MNTFTDFGMAWVQWLIQTSWQATVLAGLILLAQTLFRRRLTPRWSDALWMLLLVRLLIPASLPSAYSLFNWTGGVPAGMNAASLSDSPASHDARVLETAAASATSRRLAEVQAASRITFAEDAPPPLSPISPPSVAALALPAPAATKDPSSDEGSLWPVAFWVWLAVVAALVLRLVIREVRFASRLRNHIPVTHPQVLRILEDCREILGLQRRVVLVETDEVETPAVHGVWTQRLLLPDGAFERFNERELRHIFLHELAHLRRRDLEVNWLATLLAILHWFNPALWFAFHQLRLDRELATDALALTHLRADPCDSYGETILKVLEKTPLRAGLPGVVGIGEDRRQIERRLRAIATFGILKPWRWLAGVLTLLIGVLALTDAAENPVRSATPQPQADSPIPPPDGTERIPSAGLRRIAVVAKDQDTSNRVERLPLRFQLDYYGRESEVLHRVTDADGAASLEFSADDLKQFSYRVETEDYVAPQGEWSKQALALLPNRLEIPVSRGVEIGGIVVDPDGKPIPGAEIWFHGPGFTLSSDSSGHSLMWRLPTQRPIAVSDSQGHWSSRCLWPSIRWAGLLIRHPRYAENFFSTEVTKAQELEGQGHPLDFAELEQRRARLTLAPGVTLRGFVLDDQGQPLSGIGVRYVTYPPGPDTWYPAFPGRTVATDPRGAFEISNLGGTHAILTVQAAGLAPMVIEQAVNPKMPDVTLRLNKGARLSGRVEDDAGRPLAGVRISFRERHLWNGVRWETTTDAHGRYDWPHAPTEKFQVRFEKEGFLIRDKTLDTEGEQIMRLKPVLQIAGKVLDAKTKRPIPNFLIVWSDNHHMLQYSRRNPVIGSNGVYSLNLGRLQLDNWADKYPHEFLFRLEAPGYEPMMSRKFSSQSDVGRIDYNLELKPVDATAVTVMDADGRPVEGAQVALQSPNGRLRLSGKPRFEDLDRIAFPTTDDNGNVEISPDPDATHLVAVHERGIGWIEAHQLDANTTVMLQRWARIEGTARFYDQPIPKDDVYLQSSFLATPDNFFSFLHIKVTTDDQGRFTMEYVPPHTCSLYRMFPMTQGAASGSLETVYPKAGETVSVTVGGQSRPVVGRLTVKNPYAPIDWRKEIHYVRTTTPRPPAGLKNSDEFAAWRRRDDIRRAFESVRNQPIHFSEDGSFRIEEMVPGTYQFSVQILDPREPNAVAYGRYIADFHRTFEVPDQPERNSQEPFDIGVFELSLKPQIEKGETPAPPFTVRDMEGREFALADFRGKYVLLDFWATWCRPCLAELPSLRDLYQKHGAREDFVLLSLSVDETQEQARDFVRQNNMPWRQGYLGEWSKTDVPEQYGVTSIPATFLINPDGKIIATDLRGAGVGSELSKWLK